MKSGILALCLGVFLGGLIIIQNRSKQSRIQITGEDFEIKWFEYCRFVKRIGC